MVGVMQRLAGLLPELGAELAAVAERLRASVVVVRGRGEGVGSGVIWERNGLIVTNHHVAPEGEAEVVLADGRSLAARVIARDPQADLAALRVAAVGLPAVEVRDSRELRVGEIVLAVGNPLGMRGAVTAGIVSGVGRSVAFGRQERRDVVQADIDLRPGSSGGALADAAGRVVGINAMVVPPGIGLAVPSATVAQFLALGGAGRAYLGIAGTAVPLPRAMAERAGMATGLLLSAVQPGSPAERAGLLVGDVLIGLDGRPLRGLGELASCLGAKAAGRPLPLTLLRGGVGREITVVPEMAA